METGLMSMIGNRAGMRRLASSHTAAIVALATLSTVGSAQATRVIARGKSDTVVKADALRIATTGPTLIILLKRIDSLAQLQDSMKIGSPEYARVDDQLSTMIHLLMPSGSDGRVMITLAPGAAEQMGRTPLAMARTKMDVEPRGWLGMFADGVHQDWIESDGHYYQYFVYPIVVTVDPNSPAAKVGVQFGDSLVAFNGMDLRRNVINLTRLIEPGRSLKVTLRRDGETKDLSIIADKIPPSVLRERRAAEMGNTLIPSRAPMAATAGDSTDRVFVEKELRAAVAGGGFGAVRATARPPMAMMAINGIFGARMTDVDSSGAVALTREKAAHGVLVTEVPAGSLAARMGLRSADMIVAIDDIDVTSLSQLHRELMLRSSNRSAQFVVVRAGKIERLTYEPR
jgi:membrane-associated protease RseP (regulator of RpoE activity)